MRRLLCLLLALAACRASKPEVDAPAGERVVVHRLRERDASRPPDQPPEWFAEEIAKAEEDEREGRYAAALETAYAARNENPDAYTDYRLRELIHRLNEKVLEVDTLSASVLAEEDPIVFGEPVRVRVRLFNRTDQDIHIPARQRDSSGSLFVFDVARKEVDVRSHVVTTTRRVLRTLEAPLDIPVGGSTELLIDLGPAGNDRPLDGFRVFTVSGVLRPVVQEVGGLRRWDPVRLAPGALRAFRPNYEHLKEDPVARIGEAVEKNAPVHLLTAAALVPPERRQGAVDALVERLRGDRGVDWAIFAALEHLTGVGLGRDADAWKAWWPRVRETFFQQPGAPTDTDTPVFANG